MAHLVFLPYTINHQECDYPLVTYDGGFLIPLHIKRLCGCTLVHNYLLLLFLRWRYYHGTSLVEAN